MRIPVSTQEPVRVTTDVPNVQYEQKRVTLTGFALNTFLETGPPNGFYWIVDSIIFDAATDGNVGTRDFHVYNRDKNGLQTRFRLTRVTAGQTVWMLGAPGAGYNGFDASSGTGSFPLTFPVMQFPCTYGLLKSTFHGAGDTCNIHLLVREYRV